MEKSTGELLTILKEKKSYTEFFREEIGELNFSSISEYLEVIISEKGLKKSDVIKKSNIDKNYAYQIFNGTKTNPSRDKMLMLAIGMELTLEETRKLLKICGLTDLYIRSPRDSIIIFSIDKHLNLMKTNENLAEYGMDILE